MKKWIRRLRGAVRTAVTWAVGWSAVGFVLGTVTVVSGIDPLSALFWIPATIGAVGFVGGLVFSGFLGLVEGRRTFDQMSLPRFAVLGLIGGLAVSLSLVAMGMVGSTASIAVTALLPLLGAGSASGSLALARSADDPYLEPPEESADVGPGDGADRRLAGG